MKNSILWALTFFLLLSFSAYAQRDPRSVITYQDFYDELSAYGTWIDYPGYGYVWSPDVAGDFAPYATNGYWLYSERGWFWKSNYSWGWAAFHYGRWLFDESYGWLWVPGYDWAPAWIEWGSFDDYYAWTPLPPEVDVSINYSSWKPHNYFWNVVHKKYILEESMSKRILPKEKMKDVVHRVSVMGSMKYNSENKHYLSGGPELGDAQKNMKRERDVPTTRVADNHAPEKEKIDKNHREVQVYKPKVESREKKENVNNSLPANPNNNKPNPNNNNPSPNNNNNNNDNKAPQTRPAQSYPVDSKQTKTITTKTSEWPTTNSKTQKSNVKQLSGGSTPSKQNTNPPKRRN